MNQLTTNLGVLLLASLLVPWALLLVLGGLDFARHRPREKTIRLAISLSSLIANATALVAVAQHLWHGPTSFEFGDWFTLKGYNFPISFQLDALSLTFLVLNTVVTTLVARFSFTYLHRERGYLRFFLLFLLFRSGMTLIVTSGTADLMFAGWEMIGLASVLLIAFYCERRQPAAAGLLAFATYRVFDIGLLLAIVSLHHYAHSSHFSAMTTHEVSPFAMNLVTALFLFGTLGKSAQLPASAWLPSAMEGPTTSSALFYGGLSVHAGIFLLLRLSPWIEQALLTRGLLIGIGLTTAFFATLVGRAQADAKGRLAYATMSQVGLIFAEIGIGWTSLALMHSVGHVLLRTRQFLLAPSAVAMTARIRGHIHAGAVASAPNALPSVLPGARWLSARQQTALYQWAHQRGHLDSAIAHYVAAPVLQFAQWLVKLDGRWLRALSGVPDAPHTPMSDQTNVARSATERAPAEARTR